MNKGVLIFAVSSANNSFDYYKLATIFVNRFRKYSALPVSIVVNNKINFINSCRNSYELFDEIIEVLDQSNQLKCFYNGQDSKMLNWSNTSRVYSYDLSPYDHTLVIDTDYIISSNFLEKCFNLDSDFLIFKDSQDLSLWRKNPEFQYISDFSIPFYWATVFLFKKNKKNEIFFNLLKFIKDNWEYYRLLYQITDAKFRNDFAFSIAIHIMSGYQNDPFIHTIPGKIFFVKDHDFLHTVKNDTLVFLVQKENCQHEYVPIKVNNLDVHIMNKFSLLEVLDD